MIGTDELVQEEAGGMAARTEWKLIKPQARTTGSGRVKE